MLTTIYEANASKLGHNNIRLMLEPLGQYSFLDEYVHVDADEEKAEKVITAIHSKLSPYVYHELALTSMAYEEDVLDNIYRVLLLGFNYGRNILDMVQFKDVMRNREIRTRVGKEACRFQEFARFHQIGNVYISHIEPKSRIVEYLGPVFQDRMPSEHFIIVDDVHKEAVIHPANEDFYMRYLSKEEFDRLLESEKVNDSYTDLWKLFYETIAIKERKNEKCQMTHFPLWTRRHAVEFL